MHACYKCSPWNWKTNGFTIFLVLRESSVLFIKMKQYQLLLFDCIMFYTHVLCHLQLTCLYRIILCGTTLFHMLVFSYEGIVLFIVHVIAINVVHVHVHVMIHTYSHIQAYLYLLTINQYLVLNNVSKLAMKILFKGHCALNCFLISTFFHNLNFKYVHIHS